MMSKECMRFRRFLIDLDQFMLDNEYYDDDKHEVICEVTEDDCYEEMMKTEEYHLLTTKKVKSTIHLFFVDYDVRSSMLRVFEAF